MEIQRIVETPHSIAPTICQVLKILRNELGDAFSVDQLVNEICYLRGKPLIMDEVPLPNGITGCCCGLQDADAIFVRVNLDEPRALGVRLHECAHFLLNHVPRLSAGPTTPTYAEFRAHPELALTMARSTYDRPTERNAETLATLLVDFIRQYERTQQQGSRQRLDDFLGPEP